MPASAPSSLFVKFKIWNISKTGLDLSAPALKEQFLVTWVSLLSSDLVHLTASIRPLFAGSSANSLICSFTSFMSFSRSSINDLGTATDTCGVLMPWSVGSITTTVWNDELLGTGETSVSVTISSLLRFFAVIHLYHNDTFYRSIIRPNIFHSKKIV